MPQDQPIILSVEEGNPNRANVRFLVDNAALAGGRGTPTTGWCWCSTARTAMRWPRARETWKDCKSRGFEVTYWQTDERGRWQRRD